MKIPKILQEAGQWHKHNDNEHYIYSFDRDITIKVIKKLKHRIKELKNINKNLKIVSIDGIRSGQIVSWKVKADLYDNIPNNLKTKVSTGKVISPTKESIDKFPNINKNEERYKALKATQHLPIIVLKVSSYKNYNAVEFLSGEKLDIYLDNVISQQNSP